jgi:hypothetical protein
MLRFSHRLNVAALIEQSVLFPASTVISRQTTACNNRYALKTST